MSRYKWIAFTQAQLTRLLEIVEFYQFRHCPNSKVTEESVIAIYEKIKKIAERKEDDITFEAILGDP